ncbi:hypothetical protein [Mycetocola miduiensis]|nr:hypothetical protein [Mycetocola miduiensis]
MSASATTTYTAKLTDGPLEGKTLSADFLDSGDPRPTVDIAAPGGKTYVYARTSGQEFESEDSDRPTAVNYRYLTTNFDEA